MAGSAVPAPAAPLTRRQIREAERARAAAEERAARERAAEERAAQERAAEERAAQERAAEERAAQERAAEERAIQERAAEERAIQERAAAQEPAAPTGAPLTRAALRAAERQRAERIAASRTWTIDVPPVAAPARTVVAAAPTVVGVLPAPVVPIVVGVLPAPVVPTVVGVLPAPASPESRAADEAETAPSPAEPADTVHDADSTATEVLTGQCSLPSRRELRGARTGTTRPADSRPPARAWAPRAAVLGAMGVLTIVAPLAGFGAPENSAFARSISGVQADASVLAILDERGAGAGTATVPESLLRDPAASSRATILQTSRAADRNALECAPLDGASGTRAAVTDEVEDQVVRPVADGTYRNSSRYGYRVHPISGAYNLHTGTDFAASLGTPIHAIADGTVEYVGPGKDGRSSMLVILRHEIGGETVYSWHVHMYANGIKVTEGEQVRAGEVIAEVGNNGNSTGPHLHFELHLDEDGTTVDPLAWLEERGAVEVSALC
ncbi:peptidoglycan DD-metalloendopeptidase family protein [Georgenia subflava]|uniref:Peptidoglycan DD-metalloendopeptidase family protein n=1 Tax=Georgenia subflava TaxID=1622177 RepID=A0A6N7EL18_9MICO|nr:peptidoglycan DD-metalloendopeptidase family protein [Georgenia subflava]MPV38839.1 peptidoglycan DD-metalloendopeptidase family protein [Georgenia subflava]